MDAGVVDGEEADFGNGQEARVNIVGAIKLDEAAHGGIETVAANFGVNFVAHGAPAIDWAFQVGIARRF